MSNGHKLHTIRRAFLVESTKADKLKKRETMRQLSNHSWVDTFYDTKSHELSGAECILMKDSDSAKYWKFFCYAHDNIMEITTDEQEIREPLSRLLNYRPKDINQDLLKPFFAIKNSNYRFHSNTVDMQLTETDYGFMHCVLECSDLHLNEMPKALDKINQMAKDYDLHSLADYEPNDFL